jgi:hypothetical protein
MSAAKLREFEIMLRKLFVEGWILMDPSASKVPAAPQGPSQQGPCDPLLDGKKTITQVIYEQLEEMVEIRYGNSLKVLWNQVSKNECAESLREIGQIVEDTLQRLHVDFGDNDLYMAFEAMHVCAWRGASAAKVILLRQKTRRLHEALGLPYSFESWREVLRQVERVRILKGEDASTVDNRVLWVAALDNATKGKGLAAAELRSLRPLVTFYVAITDGTGNVERMLGAHKTFLDAHVGGPDSEMSEVCLEIAREGPRTEADVCDKNGHTVVLTDWSRRCAQIWRGLYGRRFACYKVRKDKGKTNTGLRLRNSMKAVGIMQARASDALVKMAAAAALDASQGDDQRTILGFDRQSLVRRARHQEGAAPGKRLLNFRKTTEQRRGAKSKVPTWAGYGPTAPPLRRKTGGMVPHMVASPNVVEKKARMSSKWVGRARFAAGSAAAADKRKATGGVDSLRSKKARIGDKGGRTISVKSLTELYSSRLDPKAMEVWFSAVAYGQRVEGQAQGGESSPKVAEHVPAILTPAHIYISEEFSRKHARLNKALRDAIAKSGSQWKAARASDRGCTKVLGLQECQAFLQKIRRLPQVAGVHATYLDKTAVLQGDLSRYGKPATHKKLGCAGAELDSSGALANPGGAWASRIIARRGAVR